MVPLAAQVRFACVQAFHPLSRLGGIAVPEFAEDATDCAAMQDQIAATLAFLDSIDRAALDGDLDRMVSFELPNGMVFDLSAFDYVRDWEVPHFAFHRTMAYAILRHLGVPLGQADYVSYIRSEARRVGKEWFIGRRYRGSPYKKK